MVDLPYIGRTKSIDIPYFGLRQQNRSARGNPDLPQIEFVSSLRYGIHIQCLRRGLHLHSRYSRLTSVY